MREEQHIMQNMMARNRYPVPEKELLFDLVLTSLIESRFSLEMELIDGSSKLSTGDYLLPGIMSKEDSSF
jgi:hypothetical protein